jgi:hypothetical protein
MEQSNVTFSLRAFGPHAVEAKATKAADPLRSSAALGCRDCGIFYLPWILHEIRGFHPRVATPGWKWAGDSDRTRAF